MSNIAFWEFMVGELKLFFKKSFCSGHLKYLVDLEQLPKTRKLPQTKQMF